MADGSVENYKCYCGVDNACWFMHWCSSGQVPGESVVEIGLSSEARRLAIDEQLCSENRETKVSRVYHELLRHACTVPGRPVQPACC